MVFYVQRVGAEEAAANGGACSVDDGGLDSPGLKSKSMGSDESLPSAVDLSMDAGGCPKSSHIRACPLLRSWVISRASLRDS